MKVNSVFLPKGVTLEATGDLQRLQSYLTSHSLLVLSIPDNVKNSSFPANVECFYDMGNGTVSILKQES